MHESEAPQTEERIMKEQRERKKAFWDKPPFLSSIFLTEWGLNLTDGMKETIIALICRIMATVKRTETN